jgi:hypothetical protein
MEKMKQQIKKVGGIIFLLLSLMVLSKTSLFAANPDYGYVIVRCTGTISVDVLDSNATAWFVVNGSTSAALSAGQTAVSIGSITVINNGSGIMCKWAVWVASIQKTMDGSTWQSDDAPGAWDLGSSPGICVARLCGVFATARPASGDFQTSAEGDDYFLNQRNMNVTNSITLNNYTYKTDNSSLGPTNNYYNSEYNLSSTQVIAPGSQRSMYFRIDTPTAILDEYPRRFVIAVKATGANQSW